MSVSIVPCPKCKSLLLSDTIQCPTCQHLLDPQRASDTPTFRLHSETESVADEIECADCGEMVRKELVRCWRCGAFMRSEIAESYEKMQQNPSSVIYSPKASEPESLDVDTAASEQAEQPTGSKRKKSRPSKSAAETAAGLPDVAVRNDDDDDDFELSPNLMTEPEDDFELAPGIEQAAATDSATYGISAPEVTDPPTPAFPSAEESPETPAAETAPASAAQSAVKAPTEKTESESPVSKAESSPAQPKTDASKPKRKADAKPKADSESKADAAAPAGSDAAVSEDGGPAHSVATGGDALLNIALEEEQEIEKRRQSPARSKQSDKPDDQASGGKVAATPRTGFLIFCPNGHQVEVQERHRGMTGRCPRCRAPFHVPPANWEDEKKKEAESAEKTAGSAAAEQDQTAPMSAGKYAHWMLDVHFHALDPQKLKLKPGSLASQFEGYDIGFAEDEVLIVSLVKKGSLFGSSEKKKPETRQAMLEHLAEEKSLDELPVPKHQLISADDLKQIRVEQPAASSRESMFAGIPVFGVGRIAVRLPSASDAGELLFASFFLSEFREFASHCGQLYGISDLGMDCGVPQADTTTELKCHYSDEPVHALQDVEFYQADPNLDLRIIGRRCQECDLVINEDSRKKEKIGGSNGRGIAKAKCPKCKKKFGGITLYALVSESQPAPAAQTEEES